MKTKFASYCSSNVCKGCKLCVKGQKLVLFMGGKCSRNCWYCSLSKNRKNSLKAYANERPIKNSSELIKEAIQGNARGAGITGGDPLVYFKQTIKYAKALKKKFGKDFHIHIYLPLPLVTKEKLEKLHKYIDEVRFHPTFLNTQPQGFSQTTGKNKNKRAGLKLKASFSGLSENPNSLKYLKNPKHLEELEKIKLASTIFGKQNTGIEVPMIPEKSTQIYKTIQDLKDHIGFANLNEFELSETNFDKMTKSHALNEDTYTARNSITKGKSLISKAKKDSLKVKVHLCTAQTKDCYQYINRLLNHKILPFGNRTEEGTVIYYCIYYDKSPKQAKSQIKKLTKNFHIDKPNNRIILKKSDVKKVYEYTDLKIEMLEEHPTYKAEYLQREVLGE